MATSPRGVSGANIQTEHTRAGALPLLAVWLVAILVFSLICGSTAGPASASTVATTPPELLVAANVYEPFVYYRDGQLVGFDVDLVNLIASQEVTGGILLGALFLGQLPQPNEIAGAVVALVGIALVLI